MNQGRARPVQSVRLQRYTKKDQDLVGFLKVKALKQHDLELQLKKQRQLALMFISHLGAKKSAAWPLKTRTSSPKRRARTTLKTAIIDFIYIYIYAYQWDIISINFTIYLIKVRLFIIIF